MKTVFLSMIFLLCAVLGVSKKTKLGKRVIYLEDIINFAAFLKNSIRYSKEPVDIILANWCERSKTGLINRILSSEGFSVSEKYDNFKKNPNSILSTEDVYCIDKLFHITGRGDSAAQEEMIQCVINDLVSLKNEAQEDSKKYGDLYIKIGISAGLFAVIICI